MVNLNACTECGGYLTDSSCVCIYCRQIVIFDQIDALKEQLKKLNWVVFLNSISIILLGVDIAIGFFK